MEEEERVLGQASQGRGDEISIPAGEHKALLSSLKQAEGMIRNDTNRETVVVFDREGRGFLAKRQLGNSVDLEQEVRRARERFEGAILTHNHPLGTSFSSMDIDVACWANLAEIRIVSPGYDYLFRRLESTMSELWWLETVRPNYKRVYSEKRSRLNPEEFAQAGRIQTLTHEVWVEVALRVGAVYNRVERKRGVKR